VQEGGEAGSGPNSRGDGSADSLTARLDSHFAHSRQRKVRRSLRECAPTGLRS
jgi:hypothetical protein